MPRACNIALLTALRSRQMGVDGLLAVISLCNRHWFMFTWQKTRRKNTSKRGDLELVVDPWMLDICDDGWCLSLPRPIAFQRFPTYFFCLCTLGSLLTPLGHFTIKGRTWHDMPPCLVCYSPHFTTTTLLSFENKVPYTVAVTCTLSQAMGEQSTFSPPLLEAQLCVNMALPSISKSESDA